MKGLYILSFVYVIYIYYTVYIYTHTYTHYIFYHFLICKILMWILDSLIDPFLIYNFKILEIDDLIPPPFSCPYFTDSFLSLTSLIITHSQCFSGVHTFHLILYLANTVFKINIFFKEVHITSIHCLGL